MQIRCNDCNKTVKEMDSSTEKKARAIDLNKIILDIRDDKKNGCRTHALYIYREIGNNKAIVVPLIT